MSFIVFILYSIGIEYCIVLPIFVLRIVDRHLITFHNLRMENTFVSVTESSKWDAELEIVVFRLGLKGLDWEIFENKKECSV